MTLFFSCQANLSASHVSLLLQNIYQTLSWLLPGKPQSKYPVSPRIVLQSIPHTDLLKTRIRSKRSVFIKTYHSPLEIISKRLPMAYKALYEWSHNGLHLTSSFLFPHHPLCVSHKWSSHFSAPILRSQRGLSWPSYQQQCLVDHWYSLPRHELPLHSF